MTPKQLLTRLYRIRNPAKLDGYIQTANELGYTSLWKAAVEKKASLLRNTDPLVIAVENKIIKAKEKVIAKEIEHQRSLEF